MILFPLYIAAVWVPAFVYRRKPLGFLFAFLGPAPIMASAWLIGLMMPQAKLAMQSWWIALYALIAASLGIGGLLLACAPRRPKPHQCERCHYDLSGNITGVCPECGRVFSAALAAHDASDEFAVVSSPSSASLARPDPRAA